MGSYFKLRIVLDLNIKFNRLRSASGHSLQIYAHISAKLFKPSVKQNWLKRYSGMFLLVIAEESIISDKIDNLRVKHVHTW